MDKDQPEANIEAQNNNFKTVPLQNQANVIESHKEVNERPSQTPQSAARIYGWTIILVVLQAIIILLLGLFYKF